MTHVVSSTAPAHDPAAPRRASAATPRHDTPPPDRHGCTYAHIFTSGRCLAHYYFIDHFNEFLFIYIAREDLLMSKTLNKDVNSLYSQ